MENKKLEQFYQLANQYEKAIWRVVITYEAKIELQKELLQEIMLAIWKSLSNFRGESTKQTYIYRVAHNTALKHVHKQSRIYENNNITEEQICFKSNPENLINNKQQLDRLSASIRRLPINQRQLISLSLEGLSYPQIAEITGLSVTNVGVRLSRAKKTLSNYLR